MKIDFKIAVLGGGLFLAAAIILALKLSQEQSTGDAPAQTAQAAGWVNDGSRPAPKPRPIPFRKGRPAEAPELSAEEAKALEAARNVTIEKMHDAAISYDPAELPVIRPYLENPDPELRAAAVDAMVVLGDASAGPMLREAAKKLDSVEEAKMMDDAANYIELPPADLKKIAGLIKKRSEEKKAANALEASKAGNEQEPDRAATDGAN